MVLPTLIYEAFIVKFLDDLQQFAGSVDGAMQRSHDGPGGGHGHVLGLETLLLEHGESAYESGSKGTAPFEHQVDAFLLLLIHSGFLCSVSNLALGLTTSLARREPGPFVTIGQSEVSDVRGRPDSAG